MALRWFVKHEPTRIEARTSGCFSCPSTEFLAGILSLLSRRKLHAIAMVGWTVQGIQKQRSSSVIQDIVVRPGRHDDGVAVSDCMVYPFDPRDAFTSLDAEQLVMIGVSLGADIRAGQ